MPPTNRTRRVTHQMSELLKAAGSSQEKGGVDPDKAVVWVIKLKGADVADETFAAHLKSVTSSRGTLLGKRSNVGIREPVRTHVAMLGPKDLFPSVTNAASEDIDLFDDLPRMYVVDSAVLARVSMGKKYTVEVIIAFPIAAVVSDSPEWTAMMKMGGNWMDIGSTDWPVRMQGWGLTALALVIFYVDLYGLPLLFCVGALVFAYKLVYIVLPAMFDWLGTNMRWHYVSRC